MSKTELQDLASAVFGGRCGLGIVSVEQGDPATLFPAEAEAMRTAIRDRVREFAAGRAAARLALNRPVPIPVSADRAPVWPMGWAGSITHAAGWALAVVTQGARLVGADLEPDDDLPAEILSEILTPDELSRFNGDLRIARRIFSIKEAVYKAQYPVTREIFDFHTLDVSLSAGRFRATFQERVGPFSRGEGITGNWASRGGLTLAGVLG